MKTKLNKVVFSTCLLWILALFSYDASVAGETKEMGGWGGERPLQQIL